MFLKNQTPLTVALVVFVGVFLLQVVLDYLLPPHLHGPFSLIGIVVKLPVSVVLAQMTFFNRRNAAHSS
jgi:hypothetical protein